MRLIKSYNAKRWFVSRYIYILHRYGQWPHLLPRVEGPTCCKYREKPTQFIWLNGVDGHHRPLLQRHHVVRKSHTTRPPVAARRCWVAWVCVGGWVWCLFSFPAHPSDILLLTLEYLPGTLLLDWGGRDSLRLIWSNRWWCGILGLSFPLLRLQYGIARQHSSTNTDCEQGILCFLLLHYTKRDAAWAQSPKNNVRLTFGGGRL